MSWKLARKAPNLARRAAILSGIRSFFTSRGYLDVDTPFLIPSPAPENHIDAIAAGSLFLHTSPELCMKRLLTAGFDKIFQICHCWREGERGSRHLPEFVMLEWYRADADYQDLMHESVELLACLAMNPDNDGSVRINGETVALNGNFERITVREAFHRFTDTTMECALRDDRFDILMTECIEPNLGFGLPTVICDYPAARAALAKLKPDDASVAERFELYLGGMELANAFSELTDAAIQRERFVEEAAFRAQRGAAVYPLPEPFLSEMASMPKAAGIALGVDRLVMLLVGAETIDDVVAFTPEEL